MDSSLKDCLDFEKLVERDRAVILHRALHIGVVLVVVSAKVHYFCAISWDSVVAVVVADVLLSCGRGEN